MHFTDRVTEQIIGAAIDVHRKYGPGLRQSVYAPCLGYDLVAKGLQVEIGKPLAVEHHGLHINRAYVLDLLVEECVIVEVKSIARIAPINIAQILTYLRLTKRRVGLIINFNVTVLKDGIRRVVNDHVDRQGGRL